ncbi:MAG TPA: DinB family protein [Bryobacteraceae bacterium]
MNRSLILIAATAALAAAQENKNPLLADQKAAYERIKTNMIKAAEKMPEDAYSFKPTPEVENFGDRIYHVANQIRPCSAVAGAPKQPEAAKHTKADAVAALKASFDACDAAWNGTTDANAMDMIQAGRGQRARLSILIGNTVHDNELYGALAVYLRLNKIVPPSSEGR